jgi:hypothetical protein
MSGSTAYDFRRLTHARVKVAGSWRGLRRGQERHLTPRIALRVSVQARRDHVSAANRDGW